ncbi:putative lumazine-binding protein [Sphingopyxis sp. LC81]|uniref:nuclear transport factor 2 family protein n=1 Tax=Sphingopyxis sp. LC81 TaxID=1502850 RepID=UPI00050DD9F6|nr:nuclear transport factor 2 family protein [Sphingopyxis sp. LC81]KGB57009.1 putative lumazine-binding protein [Sphingopyxis sp. LC81]
MPIDPVCLALPFIAALLAAAPAAAAPAPSSPEAALEAYVDGLRTGRVERLQALFLPDGQFCTLAKEGAAPIGCKRFSEVLGDWAARPDPAATGRVLDRRDATPSMSAVTYELHFGGDRYVDQLLLYRTDAGWRVVAKTTAITAAR